MSHTISKVLDHCHYSAGPYMGYIGRAEYDREAQIFHGQVVGTKDVITFQARSIDKLRQAFVESVDDYLNFCKSRGESPEKPFSGKFVVRISPELHRQLSLLADQDGQSLNALVEDCLSRVIGEARAQRKSRRPSIGKSPRKKHRA